MCLSYVTHVCNNTYILCFHPCVYAYDMMMLMIELTVPEVMCVRTRAGEHLQRRCVCLACHPPRGRQSQCTRSQSTVMPRRRQQAEKKLKQPEMPCCLTWLPSPYTEHSASKRARMFDSQQHEGQIPLSSEHGCWNVSHTNAAHHLQHTKHRC